MTIHLKYGGSTAARTIQCPAWHRLAEEVPFTLDGGANVAADTGTMLHNCMETIYSVDDYMDDPFDAIGELLEEGVHYNNQHLTPELVKEKLKPAVTAVEDLLESLDISDWKCEPFVKIDDDIGGSIDMLGISDDKKTVLILDYKFGYNSVAVEGNKQLQFYALAAATDPSTRDWFDTCDTIVLAVIQPNEDGDDLQTWEISMEQLDDFETEYLAAVDKAEDPKTQPNSGFNCKFCPAMATCPVKTGEALKASRMPEIAAEKLAEYLPLAEDVIEWAKEVQKIAHQQLELGTPIKGYKLVNKRATRTWNDIEAVEDKVRKSKKIKMEDGFDFKLKSPAQMEKVCKEKGVPFKQFEEYVSAISSGTTLAKESDKRPAAVPVQGLAQLNAMTQE